MKKGDIVVYVRADDNAFRFLEDKTGVVTGVADGEVFVRWGSDPKSRAHLPRYLRPYVLHTLMNFYGE